jgi:hypothetical protein
MPPSPSIEPKFAIDDAGKVTGEYRWLSPDLNVNYLPITPTAVPARDLPKPAAAARRVGSLLHFSATGSFDKRAGSSSRCRSSSAAAAMSLGNQPGLNSIRTVSDEARRSR